MKKLAEKVTVITGGGRGIGRAIALRFAEEGSAVLVAGSTEEPLLSTAKQVRDGGGRAVACLTDVADEAAVERMISTALKEFGGIDVLINNAGIIGPTAPVVHINLAEWERTLAVNLTGALLCAKHVLPGMMERMSGRIINITSVAGLVGYAMRSAYAASKWGMIGFNRTLALEAGRYNITVNAIAPGPVRGPRMDEVIRRRAAELGNSVEEVERDYVGRIALGRMVEESDITAMALFLASDDAGNITGETFTVSGGYPL